MVQHVPNSRAASQGALPQVDAGSSTSAAQEQRRPALPGNENLPSRGPLPGADSTGSMQPRLNNLPLELLRDVADRLDADSAVALASTSRVLFESIVGVTVKALLLQQLEQPGDGYAAMRQALHRAARIPETEAGIRGEVLVAVAGKMHISPGPSVFGLVDELLRTAAPLAPSQQADVLSVLASNLGLSIASDQGAALEKTLGALASLPGKYLAAPLKAIVESFPKLVTSPLLQKTIAQLTDPSAAAPMLTALAEGLPHAEDAETQRQSFDFIAREIGRLPVHLRREPLVSLTEHLSWLQLGREEGLHQIAEALDELEPQDAAGVLAPLALHVSDLPHLSREAAFRRIEQSIDRLTPPAQDTLLIKLGVRMVNEDLWSKPEHERVMGGLLQRIEQRPDLMDQIMPRLITRERTAILTTTLASRLNGLPPEVRHARIDTLLAVTGKAITDYYDLSAPLSELARQMKGLPAGQAFDRTWQTAMKLWMQASSEAGAFINHLHTPAGPLAELIPKLPPQSHEQSYERLYESGRYLMRGRGEVLQARVAILPTLPDGARHEAIEWIQKKLPQLMPQDKPNVMAGLARVTGSLPLPRQAEMVALLLAPDPYTSEGPESSVLLAVASAIADLAPQVRQVAFDGVFQRLRSSGNAGVLKELARSAAALPHLAAREAVERLLKAQSLATSDAGNRSSVLVALARHALPRLLQQPVPMRQRIKHPLRRHVSRESLLDLFVAQVHNLPSQERTQALQQMIENASHSAASAQGAASSGDKSGKLLSRLHQLRDEVQAG